MDRPLIQPEPPSSAQQQHNAAQFDTAAGRLSPSPNINYAEAISDRGGLRAKANLEQDGRIRVSLDVRDADRVAGAGQHQAGHVLDEFGVDRSAAWSEVPSMCIVIMIVGSRGDVQPYVALGKRLVRCGHRVRIATHETFRGFVTGEGLEFFNIGGDPHDLLSYMVKNPGLVPGLASLTNGDIGRKRKMLKEMINGSWQSCFATDPVTNRTFVADVIISNPPAFAHIHCAEALGVPLHMSFTMPWTATSAFPQPLVNISTSNTSSSLSNYLSYSAADLLTWQGLGDVINTFRTNTLGLSPLSIRTGPGIIDKLQVPWTYCMSPALVPKPDDWRANIDVVGFYFLDLASNYTPSPELEAFLKAGEPPMYIGFGSVVIDDPIGLTKTIFAATERAGVRAIISAGWGGLGTLPSTPTPPHIYLLKSDIPHDWLFSQKRVSAVMHHGGAGTTAIGLAKGIPTIVVPFFGDQAFWGNMVWRAGSGPKPLLSAQITSSGGGIWGDGVGIPSITIGAGGIGIGGGMSAPVKRLVEAIKVVQSESAKKAAEGIQEKIKREHGVRKGVESLYRHLPLLNMRCDIVPGQMAAWWDAEHCLKLSPLAAQTIAHAKLLDVDTLYLHRSKYYDHADARRTCEACRKSSYTRFYNASPSQLAKLYSDGLIPSRPGSKSGSADNSPQSPLKVLDPDSPGPTDKLFDAVLGTAKNLIHGKLAFGSSPPPPQYPPKRPECPIHEEPIRRVRLAQNLEAYNASTQAERDAVIAKFKEEIHLDRKLVRRATVDEMVKRLPANMAAGRGYGQGLGHSKNRTADERTTRLLKEGSGEIGITVEEPLMTRNGDGDVDDRFVVSPVTTNPNPVFAPAIATRSISGSSNSTTDDAKLTFPEPVFVPPGSATASPGLHWDRTATDLERGISQSLQDPDAQFNQELEVAMKLSLEEYRQGSPTPESRKGIPDEIVVSNLAPSEVSGSP